MGPPKDYKPRRNNYKPLRDLHQQLTESKQPSRAPDTPTERAPTRPGPERHYGDRSAPGGPLGGGRVEVEKYGIKQVRAAAADRQARLAAEQASTPPPRRTPIKELVKRSAQEVTKPVVGRTKPLEVERS